MTKDLCTYAQTYEEKAEYGGGGVSFLPINRRIEVRIRKLTSNIFAHFISISMDGCFRAHEKEGWNRRTNVGANLGAKTLWLRLPVPSTFAWIRQRTPNQCKSRVADDLTNTNFTTINDDKDVKWRNKRSKTSRNAQVDADLRQNLRRQWNFRWRYLGKTRIEDGRKWMGLLRELANQKSE